MYKKKYFQDNTKVKTHCFDIFFLNMSKYPREYCRVGFRGKIERGISIVNFIDL